MKMRSISVAALALVMGALVIRNAFVGAFAVSDPPAAARLWRHHPTVTFQSGLGEVGAAAAVGRKVSPATVEGMVATATRAPLAPEPYLVRAVQARLQGDNQLALRALLEARKRDPRSVPTRFFLAEHYVKAGETRLGLAEISALTRLVPQSLDGIAPHLAAFARAPGGAAQVRALLRSQPQLEPLLLNVLAADAGDSRLAMSLWSGRHRDEDRGWQERLVTTLVAAGRYLEAKAAWRRFDPAAEQVGELVDPQFAGKALPPFGWTLATGPAGFAEPDGGGRLHVLYYGRDDFVLAHQLLLLAPGSYRLSMRVSGASPAADALAWTLRCLPSSRAVLATNLNSARRGLITADFAIPQQDCPAQRLELAGTAPELPEQADLTIAELRLLRRGQ